MDILPAHVSMYHLHVCNSLKSEEGVGSPETQGIDNCELPRGCGELSRGPLQEQPFLLTTGLTLQFCECKSYLEKWKAAHRKPSLIHQLCVCYNVSIIFPFTYAL